MNHTKDNDGAELICFIAHCLVEMNSVQRTAAQRSVA